MRFEFNPPHATRLRPPTLTPISNSRPRLASASPRSLGRQLIVFDGVCAVRAITLCHGTPTLAFTDAICGAVADLTFNHGSPSSSRVFFWRRRRGCSIRSSSGKWYIVGRDWNAGDECGQDGVRLARDRGGASVVARRMGTAACAAGVCAAFACRDGPRSEARQPLGTER